MGRGGEWGRRELKPHPPFRRLGRSYVRCDTKLAPGGGIPTIGESGTPSSKPESASPRAWGWRQQTASARAPTKDCGGFLSRKGLNALHTKRPGIGRVFKKAKAKLDGWHKTTSSPKASPPEQDQAWALELMLRLSWKR